MASHYYREALDQKPDNPPIWVQYGHALKESGHVPEAESAYRKSLALNPNVADTHLQLGHAVKIQGRTDEAAVSYLRALALDPTLHHAAAELTNLGYAMFGADDRIRGSVQRALRQLTAPDDDEDAASLVPCPSIVFDISDLVKYFGGSRIPSGIQRVQISVLTALLRRGGLNCNLTIACCTLQSDYWIKVPRRLFLDLTDLAVAGGRRDDAAWRAVISELHLVLAVGKPLEFQRNAVLINLGSSWWLPHYFLLVRTAKARSGISYVPFIHDCIPMILPQLCDKQTVRDYISWLVGVFFHADGYLTNSASTAADLKKFAKLLGHEISVPRVVRLDGCFTVEGPNRDRSPENNNDGIIAHYELDREDFVLLVATLEARKNHAMAFNAWLSLIKKRGLRRTPRLVCVGKLDPTGELVVARLHASELLEQKVLLLSQISDEDLAALYRRCLFTLYPSLYEGWGLPITEALSFGKVPLTSTASSLVEAGRDLAEYFDLGSVRDLIEKLERLIDDAGYRSARESKIRESFRSRSWMEIGAEIMQSVLPSSGAGSAAADPTPIEPREIWPMPAQTGRYYGISQNDDPSIWPGKVVGEMYRMGNGWWSPEGWGTWLRKSSADLAFSLEESREFKYLVYLGLHSPLQNTEYRVDVVGTSNGESGKLEPGEDRWLVLEVNLSQARHAIVHLRITGGGLTDLADPTNGGTLRAVSLGVLGFYVCREDDLLARHSFIEALRLKRLHELQRVSGVASRTEGTKTERISVVGGFESAGGAG